MALAEGRIEQEENRHERNQDLQPDRPRAGHRRRRTESAQCRCQRIPEEAATPYARRVEEGAGSAQSRIGTTPVHLVRMGGPLHVHRTLFLCSYERTKEKKT